MLKNFFNKIKVKVICSYVFLTMMMTGIMPVQAHAAGDFNTLFSNLKTLADNAGPAIKALFLVCGLVMLGLGIFKWIHAANRQEPKGPAIVCVVAGVILLGIWTFAQTVSSTMGLNVDAQW